MALLSRLLTYSLATGLLLANSTTYAESGRGDYDLDDDGLIEINDLADLDEIRNNLDGSSLYGESTGCPVEGCKGFELTRTLDFDTNSDGQINASDAYWNGGEGWRPIGGAAGVASPSFGAIFEGNHYTLKNLWINRVDEGYVGLFGTAFHAQIQNLVLSGPLSSVKGKFNTGALSGLLHLGSVTNVMSTVSVSGFNHIGGIAGEVQTTAINLVAVVADIVGGNTVGGLFGYHGNVDLSDSYSSGSVSGSDTIGGLIGSGVIGSVSRSFSMSEIVSSHNFSGGLMGQSNNVDIIDSFYRGKITGDFVGGLVGITTNGIDIESSYALAEINASGLAAGLIGMTGGHPDWILNSYWATDIAGTTSAIGNKDRFDAYGRTSAQLQCVPNNDCSSDIFELWGDYWDYQSASEPPTLIHNGVSQTGQDRDGDGVVDAEDVFPLNPLKWEDSDIDGIDDHGGAWKYYLYRKSAERSAP